MPVDLKSAHEELTNQVPHMQRVGRRIEPDVERDGRCAKSGSESVAVGGVMNEAAGGQIAKQIHLPMLPADGADSWPL
jgi:hypothetical protein